MKHQIKTKFDGGNPNKNKVATLSGLTKTEKVYKDVLDFVVNVDGIDKKLGELLESLMIQDSKSKELIEMLVKEVKILNDKLDVQKKAIESLDKRIRRIETMGNL